MILQIILQVLPLLPAFTWGEPAPVSLATGAGTMLVVNCQPGQRVTITPGNFSAAADSEGNAKLTVPAQFRDSDPYQVNGIKVNGTVTENEILVGSCL